MSRRFILAVLGIVIADDILRDLCLLHSILNNYPLTHLLLDCYDHIQKVCMNASQFIRRIPPDTWHK
ncbi:hypothetical transcript [Echinococcus multilocularis]|uniref:Hypothetical transcript n=1 Tax=Echinococcus multilocularis TaxID=6211 RepID=A0A068XTA9_ECHMU|nr:hypothetical transcript [Echinococcus multilocularis]